MFRLSFLDGELQRPVLHRHKALTGEREREKEKEKSAGWSTILLCDVIRCDVMTQVCDKI